MPSPKPQADDERGESVAEGRGFGLREEPGLPTRLERPALQGGKGEFGVS